MILEKIESIVKYVLINYEDTRNDDFVLVYRVYKEINEDLVIRELFCEVMLNHYLYNLPAIESITRARRKLQAKYEELKPSEKVKKARIEKEEEYIEYSRR